MSCVLALCDPTYPGPAYAEDTGEDSALDGKRGLQSQFLIQAIDRMQHELADLVEDASEMERIDDELRLGEHVEEIERAIVNMRGLVERRYPATKKAV